MKNGGGQSNLSAVRDYWEDIEAHTAKGLAPHEQEVFPILSERVADAERVLEIGVGSGRWITALRETGHASSYHGIDITSAVHRADCEGTKADTRRLPYRDESFDVTFSIGVIEHFPESKKAIREHARITNSGGWVFIITPHLAPITVKRYISFYRRGEDKDGSFEQIRGRNLTKRQLENWFDDVGLENVDVGCYGDVWVPGISQFPIVQRSLRWLCGGVFGSFVYAVGRKP